MKSAILITILFTSFCLGAFEDWTSKDGRTAQFELVKTTGEGDSLAGEFRMKNGKTVSIKAADFDQVGAAKLKEAAAKNVEIPGNDNFELVLITSDSDEKSMEKCASDKSMPWPQLNLSDADKFKKKINTVSMVYRVLWSVIWKEK